MTEEQLTQAARAWVQAERTGGKAVGLSQDIPQATVADAYAMQAATLRRQQELGEMPAGYKIAFTADALREKFGLREPAVGYMLRKDLHPSGFPLAPHRWAGSRLEPEIALRLRSDLCGRRDFTEAEVRRAVAGVRPAYEIVRGRVQSGGFSLPDMIGDNASFGAAVLGGGWTPADALDLAAVRVTVTENGAAVAEGTGAGVMGDPVRALVWLANKLPELGGGLHAGDIVMTGSLTGQIPTRPGQEYVAAFSGLGEVRVRTEQPTPDTDEGKPYGI